MLGNVTVTFDGNALYGNAPAMGVTNAPLTQVGGSEFSATIGGETGDLTFYPGGDGATGWLVTREGVAAREVALP